MFHPTTFGKYFLTRRIAVGGMAEVFAAKLYGSDGFEKDLVIKQILPQHARDPEFVQSFVAEAKIAVSLNHANVVGIYELGRVDGTYFIAMEYVDGLDVFALMEAARRHYQVLDPGLAVLITEEVARGLEYAHRKKGPDGRSLGLVHRDLNPRNVLISREGDVKILDFGIAKVASPVMPKTRAGVVKGTTGYMSPEQAVGREVDARTDIYQAGLLLHELLTGNALFWRPDDQMTRDLMRRHHVPPPSVVIGGLPSELDQVVMSALERDPNRRIPTAGELSSRLNGLRYRFFPDSDHNQLGIWTNQLMDLDLVATQQIDDELPATEDFSEVISRAIEQSIGGKIETIATRAPSGVFAAAKPTTGSQPLDPNQVSMDLPSLTGTPVPVAPAAVVKGTPVAGSPSRRSPTPAQLAAISEDLAPPARTEPLKSRVGLPVDRGESEAETAVQIHVDEEPTVVSTHLSKEIAGADPAESAQEESPQLLIDAEGNLVAPEAAPKKRKRWFGLFAIVLIIFGGGLYSMSNTGPDPATAATASLDPKLSAERTVMPEKSVERAPIPPSGVDSAPSSGVDSATKTASQAAEATPSAEKSKTLARNAAPKPKKKVSAQPEVGARPATIAFGTRSCSSKVTVDGQVVTRTTPSYGHRISPGRHTVILEGTGCPAQQKANSLQTAQPRLSTKVTVVAGADLKVIADYKRGRVIVRNTAQP